MKRRVVTTQEAAAEDDGSAGLRIGSVGVRGQQMNARSETRLRATEMCDALPPQAPALYRWHHSCFTAGNRNSPEGFYCNTLCIRGLYSMISLCSALRRCAINAKGPSCKSLSFISLLEQVEVILGILNVGVIAA